MNEMAVCVLVGCWGGLQDFGACGPKMLVSCPDYKWFILCMCTKTNTHTHTICTHPCRRSFPWQTHPHCVSVVLFPSQWYWPSGTPTGPQTRNKLVTTTKDTQTQRALLLFTHFKKQPDAPKNYENNFLCLFIQWSILTLKQTCISKGQRHCCQYCPCQVRAGQYWQDWNITVCSAKHLNIDT